jgi:hypothetical protein
MSSRGSGRTLYPRVLLDIGALETEVPLRASQQFE